MAKRQKNKAPEKVKATIPPTEQLVDKYARILQVLALLSVVVLLILKGVVPAIEVPGYVIIGLLGLAVGLNPEQIGKILTDVIKSFIGKK